MTYNQHLYDHNYQFKTRGSQGPESLTWLNVCLSKAITLTKSCLTNLIQWREKFYAEYPREHSYQFLFPTGQVVSEEKIFERITLKK